MLTRIMSTSQHETSSLQSLPWKCGRHPPSFSNFHTSSGLLVAERANPMITVVPYLFPVYSMCRALSNQICNPRTERPAQAQQMQGSAKMRTVRPHGTIPQRLGSHAENSAFILFLPSYHQEDTPQPNEAPDYLLKGCIPLQ